MSLDEKTLKCLFFDTCLFKHSKAPLKLCKGPSRKACFKVEIIVLGMMEKNHLMDINHNYDIMYFRQLKLTKTRENI